MTSAQLFAIRPEFHQELPDAALSSHVIVTCDLRDDEPGACSECPERSPFGPEPVGTGVYRIAWQQETGGRWYFMDACNVEHCEQALAYVIGLKHRRYPRLSIVLRVPEHWALKARSVA